jgi:hypothetical protein
MAHRSKIIKEWVDIQVTAANQSYKRSFEVDKHAKVIIGIAITATFDDQLYFRGSQRIAINDREFYPEDYESKMLMQGINVPANARIIDLGEEVHPGNRKVDFTYQDTDHPSATFQAYRVRLYVYSRIECENDKA